MSLPAQFVKLPVQKLKNWLNVFEGLTTIISRRDNRVDTINIKRLRIEYDNVAPMFEQIWQNEEPEYQQLNNHWEQVWLDTTNVLPTEPAFNGVDERFDFALSEFTYDLQAYKPNLVNL